METILQLGRIVAVTVLLIVVAIAHATVNPPVALSQDDEKEKEECLDNEELGPCLELRHVFDNTCEGDVCYSALEACCLDEVVILVPR